MQFYQNNNHKLCGFFWQIKYLFLKLVPSKGKVGFGSLKNYIGFVALLLTHNYLMGLRYVNLPKIF